MTNEPDDNQTANQTAEKTTDEETHMPTDEPTNENTGDAAPRDAAPGDGNPASDGAADSGANPFFTEQPDAEPTRPVPPAGEPAATNWDAPAQPQAATDWTQQQSASPGYSAPTAGQPADQYGAGQYGTGQYSSQYGAGQYGSQYGAGGYGGAVPPGGYPPSGYPPGGYGYGYPTAPPRTDDKAIWALVSSIAGFVLFPLVLHVVGWVLANQSLRSIRESGGTLRGEGVAKTARVLGIVGVVLSVLGLIAAVLFFAIAIPLGIFAASNNGLDLDVGTETVAPTSLAQIDGEDFSHDIGEVTYDLSGLDFAGRAADMSVELGAGTLTIEVPDDVTVNLDAEVGAGDLDVFGTSTSGIDVSRADTFEGDEPGEGVLDLMVRVDVGELAVSRG